jgi:hypothetical protein
MFSDFLDKLTINISESKDTVSCYIHIEPRGRWCRRKISIDTGKVFAFLENKGYKIEKENTPNVEIKNFQENISNSATWDFSIKKKPIRKRKARKPTSQK